MAKPIETENATAKTVKAVAPTEVEVEKKVTIRIPRERDDNEDKVVWVNDRRFLIQRGVNVEVPESVALVLQQEEDALQTIYNYEERMQR